MRQGTLQMVKGFTGQRPGTCSPGGSWSRRGIADMTFVINDARRSRVAGMHAGG